MSVREVLTYPDPRLRQVCRPVEDVADPAIQAIIQDLIDTGTASGHSVGIAAPQIGELWRIVYIDCSAHVPKGFGPQLLINPEIIAREDSYSMREGCMSLPEYVGPVPRARRVTVKALDRQGREIELKAAKFEAVVVQHELDHLDGVLFIDRMVSPKTDLMRRIDLLRRSDA
ncbi:MAG: peptide deformylase [Candidatus Sericytochromatia bacterium]